MKHVYLAGPVSGLSLDQCITWRRKVRLALLPEIESYSPLRGAELELAEEEAVASHYPKSLLFSEAALVRRDFSDVQRADMVLVNLLGAPRVTQGTVYEIGWAYALGKPIAMAVENEGNIHEHAFLRQQVAFRVDNLPDLVTVARSVLLPA